MFFQQQQQQTKQAGGFSPSHNDSPPTSPSKDRTNQNFQTLTPVTIKQLLAAKQNLPDDTFHINHREINQITIIGQIQKITSQMTHINYILNDGTGSMEVRQWIDPEDKSDFTASSRAKLRENVYVRDIGQLRSFQDQRSVVVFRIIPIENYNEVVFHFLEVLYVSLNNSRSTSLPAMKTGSSLVNTSDSTPNSSSSSSSSSSGGGGDETQFQKAILDCIRSSNNTPKGVNFSSICQVLMTQGMPLNIIRETMDGLIGSGKIFSPTGDNEFFKTSL